MAWGPPDQWFAVIRSEKYASNLPGRGNPVKAELTPGRPGGEWALQFTVRYGMDTEDATGLKNVQRPGEGSSPNDTNCEAAMKVKFLGAARTVTGSCYIMETAGRRFAIDCGMHQGNAEIEKTQLGCRHLRSPRNRVPADDARPHGPFRTPPASRTEGVPRQGVHDPADPGSAPDHAPRQRPHPGDGGAVEEPQTSPPR